ncbi:sensor domain-containing diguanylate cyclase [Clostridium sp. ZS2-4]|uniref:sensor domain-containing diguanylate cyclase n=1 Tax=Clostridium sp. ZS2-4 TaxID=2987703 RepID=UPI00227B8F0F|nr:sensor domain-containing diguanylate cyclase [Clostridium sp. ZS2-4]MCY6356170.1 sensor domain-containing diguanylate cyclase [Clostridium sp. ZS2-4]
MEKKGDKSFEKSNDINDINTNLKLENETLKKEKSIITKELEESRGMNWILSQVIKASGTLDLFENLMKNITDIIMGVMGPDTCTVWIKNDNNYTTYSRSTYNGDKYEVKENEKLPDFLLRLKETAAFDVSNRKIDFLKGKSVKSVLIAPLEDFRIKNRSGVIVVEHRSKDFFTKNIIDFFDILAIQVSIVAINSKLFEKINEVSNRDILTKCYNRKYLEKLMLNMNTKQDNYTLAVFDLDNFKKVNDTYGHEKGDEVLVEVSNLAIDVTQKHNGDVIRFGGDEFIIILFKPLSEAMKILDHFREKVAEIEVVKEMGINVTTTIGVASYPETVTQMKDIFTIADKVLVEGKTKGLKNRIHIGYSENIREQTNIEL